MMNMPGNIFLVGLMGAGKTTVGRALARLSRRTFVDSDHEIEARTGVRIPLIFEIEGETGFRQRETEVLAELTAQRGIVLATGGGAVLASRNREMLKANGTVVYLWAPVEELYQRTRHDKGRPLLQTADPLARLHDLYTQRDPIYRELADLVVESGVLSVHQLALQILNKVNHRHAHRTA